MNFEAGLKPKHWKQIAGIVLVLAIAGYQYAQPTLEKWFNVDLPSITGNDQNRPSQPGSQSSQANKTDDRYQATLPTSKSGSNQHGSGSQSGKTSSFLTSVGRDNLQSPAGLLYTMGPRREHRVDHVMRHGQDDPGRPVHSVFEGSRDEILATIDEAYSLVKANSSQVRTSRSGGKDEHTIRMNRKVGYEGGQSGKRKGYPSLKNIKLILDGNRVITAYPFR